MTSITKWKSSLDKQDFMASIVVFLVALPLCLGIAVASGAPPISGIVGGIVGGIVVGMLGGSPLQVSGPANGLIVISWSFIATHSFELLLWATVLAGAIQLLAGSLRVGQMFRAVTPGVILGLMLGFAIVIFFGQVHVILGATPFGGTIENIRALGTSLSEAWIGGPHAGTALVGVMTIAAIFGWERFAPQSLRFMPAALFAVLVGTAVANFGGISTARIQIPSDVFASMETLSFSGWSSLLNIEVIETAFLIAFIASAETLLCCTAVDKLHTGPRTRYNKELTAQGLGNMVSGFFGGLPITGVIIRSSANVAAGGKTKYATILHGVWLLLSVVLLAGLLNQIPLAVLAGVLVHAVTKLVKPAQIKSLWQQDRFGVLVFLTTGLGIVFFGVMIGVVTGLALSMIRLIRTFNELEVKMQKVEDSNVVSLSGSATFLRIPYIASQLENVDRRAKVTIDTSCLIHIDSAVYNLIRDWEIQHQAGEGVIEKSITESMKNKTTDKICYEGNFKTAKAAASH